MMRRAMMLACVSASLSCSGCASSGEYMGIDLARAKAGTPLPPERVRTLRERELLILIAMLEGCYERVPGGFKPVPVMQAKSFECAKKLAAIEKRSDALGIGGGPGGMAAMSLAALARQAQAGSKRAQLELGIRFEEGIGVAPDLRKARKLYGKAASASGGTLWVYSPPVGNGTSGRVIPINQGPRQPGLAEAQRRLAALKPSS